MENRNDFRVDQGLKDYRILWGTWHVPIENFLLVNVIFYVPVVTILQQLHLSPSTTLSFTTDICSDLTKCGYIVHSYWNVS